MGVAAASHLGSVALLANISGEPQDVILPERARVWRLDEETFATAIGDPDWLRGGEPEHCSVVALSAFAFAFVDLPSPPEIAG